MASYNESMAPSHREVIRIYQAIFDARVEAGEIRPLLLPHDAYALLALLIYLCIPHTDRPWLYSSRWLVLAFIIAFDLNLIAKTTTVYAGAGFGVGLIAAWGILWSATWLLWNAPQFDAKRVQRKDEKISTAAAVNLFRESTEHPSDRKMNSIANGSLNGSIARNDLGLRQRKTQNGHSKKDHRNYTQEMVPTTAGEKQVEESSPPEYYWQPYPVDSLRDRIDWVCDLVFNFRGPGWNWEVPTNPGLPAHVKAALGEPIDIKSMQTKSSVGIRRFTSRAELFRNQVPRIIFGYLLLDLLKVVLMKDPYFIIGPNDFPLPPHMAGFSETTVGIIHQLLSLVSIITALETIFLLAPIFFCLMMGPNVLNARGEFWEYLTTWGAFDNITRKGLQGLWGGWWHQTFRFAFAAPTNFLIKHGILKPKSPATNLFGAIVAFAMSGFLHASGSYTQIPTTIPVNCFCFFMLQAVGIILQSSFCAYFKPSIRRLPMTVRTSGNFAFTFTWLYYTSPLLTDDFARGGIWLFQPIPISPLRALGYGAPGDSWWCWEDFRPRWYVGKHWWEQGLTF